MWNCDYCHRWNASSSTRIVASTLSDSQNQINPICFFCTLPRHISQTYLHTQMDALLSSVYQVAENINLRHELHSMPVSSPATSASHAPATTPSIPPPTYEDVVDNQPAPMLITVENVDSNTEGVSSSSGNALPLTSSNASSSTPPTALVPCPTLPTPKFLLSSSILCYFHGTHQDESLLFEGTMRRRLKEIEIEKKT